MAVLTSPPHKAGRKHLNNTICVPYLLPSGLGGFQVESFSSAQLSIVCRQLLLEPAQLGAVPEEAIEL